MPQPHPTDQHTHILNEQQLILNSKCNYASQAQLTTVHYESQCHFHSFSGCQWLLLLSFTVPHWGWGLLPLTSPPFSSHLALPLCLHFSSAALVSSLAISAAAPIDLLTDPCLSSLCITSVPRSELTFLMVLYSDAG